MGNVSRTRVLKSEEVNTGHRPSAEENFVMHVYENVLQMLVTQFYVHKLCLAQTASYLATGNVNKN